MFFREEFVENYRERTYAGVLGKVIGVYYGRPVEGWSYKKIRDTFNMVDHYVAEDLGIPLHVADDDLAGTFTFLNALEDFKGNLRKITSRDFGECWLDYIIENKTIFWWGGYGRSTEHTAYINLRNGIKAPESGSIQRNGKGVAEQIGAQIFMDAIAMLCPGDPEMARYLVRQSARVSHDGIAVESACFLASMDAMAYREGNLQKLIDEGLRMANCRQLSEIVTDVQNHVTVDRDFRSVRQWLEDNYSYKYFPGNCHVIPNLALIIASLELGGDSFYKALEYCVSGGWDTDCNGANIGVLNGVRLGLDAMTDEYDFRSPVSDWFYKIAANGEEAVTDAVHESERIIRLHDRLYGLLNHRGFERKPAKYSFSMPGSVQGFITCPFLGKNNQNPVNISIRDNARRGLVLSAKAGSQDCVSVPTMWNAEDQHGSYELMGTPKLYEAQTIVYRVSSLSGQAEIIPYIAYYDFDDQIKITKGDPQTVVPEEEEYSWKLPALGGMTIARLGFCLNNLSEEQDAEVLLSSVDWHGAPEFHSVCGSLRNTSLDHPNMQMNAFLASAKQFSSDSRRTFTVSDTDRNGLTLTGAHDWKNYRLSCIITTGLNKGFGLVIRARGLRHYYSVFVCGGKMSLLRKDGSEETILAQKNVEYEMDKNYPMYIEADENRISAGFSEDRISASDDEHESGECGFRVDCGTFLADEVKIEGYDEQS